MRSLACALIGASLIVLTTSVGAGEIDHAMGTTDVPDGYQVSVLGETLDVNVDDALRAGLKALRAGGAGAGGETIKAPMPGVVVELKAAEGDIVAAGDPVVIVEAMKMRNEFGTKNGGRIDRIVVEPGQSVERNQPMVIIVPEEES